MYPQELLSVVKLKSNNIYSFVFSFDKSKVCMTHYMKVIKCHVEHKYIWAIIISFIFWAIFRPKTEKVWEAYSHCASQLYIDTPFPLPLFNLTVLLYPSFKKRKMYFAYICIFRCLIFFNFLLLNFINFL